MSLEISEIYHSIQGESTNAGKPCIFVRLSRCNLRCSWCDSSYTFNKGEITSFEEILNKIQSFNCNLVLITGGEPLMQDNCQKLINLLVENNYEVMLETAGNFPIENINNKCKCIIDIKCPTSNMQKSFFLDNLKYLKSNDELKFVVANEDDFNWAIDFIDQYELEKKEIPLLFSPVYKILEEKKLAKLILNSNKKIRLNLQQHKYIWPNENRSI